MGRGLRLELGCKGGEWVLVGCVKLASIMTTLLDEIAAYDRMLDVLETQHLGKWVVIRDGEIQASCDIFGDAFREAVLKYGRGPYLIRQVGAGVVTLPASIEFSCPNALS